MKILLVEDEEMVAKALEKILVEQNYIIDIARNGAAGWELVETLSYELIILDIVLPELDGIKFCKLLREKGYQIPVLLLTGQSTSHDKVAGLDAGADDYMVKPFEVSELLARIRVLLRRGNLAQPTVLEWSNLRLDPNVCEVTYNGYALNLTPKEYRLLELFLRYQHRVFSRSAILDHLWSFEEAPSEDAVTVHIKDLRQKLKRAGAPKDLIETVYGRGYRLKKTSTPPVNSVLSQSQANLIDQQTQAGLAAIWEKYRGLSYDRLAILTQATTELLDSKLGNEQRQKAQRAAHKLAGALGIFGFAKASRLARQLEQLFESSQILDDRKATQLTTLLSALRQALEQAVPTLMHAEAKLDQDRATLAFSQLLSHQADIIPAGSQPILIIIDDDERLAKQVTKLASQCDSPIELIPDLLLLSKKLPTASKPETLLLNLSLADATEDALALLTKLVNRTPPVPVLLFTAHEDLVNQVKVARLEAHVVLQKPTRPESVLAVIQKVRLQMHAADAKVMIVDDDSHLLAIVQALLEPVGLQLLTLNEPLQFWQTLDVFSPDLLILDVKMPHFSGVELCQVLRSTPRWWALPILVLTAYVDTKTVEQILVAGANDCLSKTMQGTKLVSRILSHLAQSRLLRSITDSVQPVVSA